MEVLVNRFIDHSVDSYNELNVIIGMVADVCTLLAVGTALASAETADLATDLRW